MFVCCDCCVLSGRGLCDGLITRPEESYRLWHVVAWLRVIKKPRTKDAKARNRAVKNTTTMGCNVRKTNKHLFNSQKSYLLYCHMNFLNIILCSNCDDVEGI